MYDRVRRMSLLPFFLSFFLSFLSCNKMWLFHILFTELASNRCTVESLQYLTYVSSISQTKKEDNSFFFFLFTSVSLYYIELIARYFLFHLSSISHLSSVISNYDEDASQLQKMKILHMYIEGAKSNNIRGVGTLYIMYSSHSDFISPYYMKQDISYHYHLNFLIVIS